MGIARTFQNIRLFSQMTVEENVLVGFGHSMKSNLLTDVFRLPGHWRQEAEFHDKALELLDIFDMRKYADAKAGNLPYGAQRRLEILRALATGPKVLLLDEPAAGMNPAETEELMENIRRIRDEFKIAILLIEHDMGLVMGVCEVVGVLDYGRIIAKGTPDDIRTIPKVIEAYLGQQGGLTWRTPSASPFVTSRHYGAIKAVRGISFDINHGEIVTLIGANGAGKSTTLNTVAGLIRPDYRLHRVQGAEHRAREVPQGRGARHARCAPRGAAIFRR